MEEISPDRMDEIAERLILSGKKKVEDGRAEIAEGQAYKDVAQLTRQRLENLSTKEPASSSNKRLVELIVRARQYRLKERDTALRDIIVHSGKPHLTREELHAAYVSRTGDDISPANLASHLSKSTLFESYGYNQWGLAPVKKSDLHPDLRKKE